MLVVSLILLLPLFLSLFLNISFVSSGGKYEYQMCSALFKTKTSHIFFFTASTIQRWQMKGFISIHCLRHRSLSDSGMAKKKWVFTHTAHIVLMQHTVCSPYRRTVWRKCKGNMYILCNAFAMNEQQKCVCVCNISSIYDETEQERRRRRH